MLIPCPKCGKTHETSEKRANAPMWGAGYWEHYCTDCWLAFGRREMENYAARSPMPLNKYGRTVRG